MCYYSLYYCYNVTLQTKPTKLVNVRKIQYVFFLKENRFLEGFSVSCFSFYWNTHEHLTKIHTLIINPNTEIYVNGFFSWHHGNIPRMDCQTMLENAFMKSVKISGKPANAWLVRLSRNNEQTISICFSKKKNEVKKTYQKLEFNR